MLSCSEKCQDRDGGKERGTYPEGIQRESEMMEGLELDWASRLKHARRRKTEPKTIIDSPLLGGSLPLLTNRARFSLY